MKMTAETDLTNFTAKDSSAKTIHSNVNRDIVLHHTSVAMVIAIVVISQMKLVVPRNIQEVAIARKHDSSVTTTSACQMLMFATDQMIVVITQTKLRQFAPI